MYTECIPVKLGFIYKNKKKIKIASLLKIHWKRTLYFILKVVVLITENDGEPKVELERKKRNIVY